MTQIKAADVQKLRTITGSGMMDCKKALEESNGDFDAAIDILRKKGQKVANKRADREASEGAVIAKISADRKHAALIVLNCETDFVAKNDDFVAFAQSILDLALNQLPADLETLKKLNLGSVTVEEEIINRTGVIGEKVDLSVYQLIKAESTVAYIHPGNKLASIAGFNKVVEEHVGKDIVMQIAAMAPIAIDQADVPQADIDKELEIGKELAINEGKDPKMAENIAKGRLSKFFKESTLLNQQFIKDNKITVKEYLQSISKDLTVTSFKRYSLSL